MPLACDVYLQEALMEGFEESRHNHEAVCWPEFLFAAHSYVCGSRSLALSSETQAIPGEVRLGNVNQQSTRSKSSESRFTPARECICARTAVRRIVTRQFQNVRVRMETTTSQGLRENSVGVSQGTYADNIVSKDILLDGASVSHSGESFSAQDCDDPKPTTICLKLLP